MKYKCGLCGQEIDDDLGAFVHHGEKHIVDQIKKQHPEWTADNGCCPKCLEYYKKELKGNSSD